MIFILPLQIEFACPFSTSLSHIRLTSLQVSTWMSITLLSCPSLVVILLFGIHLLFMFLTTIQSSVLSYFFSVLILTPTCIQFLSLASEL